MSKEQKKESGSVRIKPSPGLLWIGIVFILLGIICCIPAFFYKNGLNRFSHSYLMGFIIFWNIILGSLFFVSLHHLTKSNWSTVIRRVAEMIASPIWILMLLFIPITLFILNPDIFGLFPWLDHEYVNADPILKGKKPYLNAPFFLIRGVVFLILWLLFSRYFFNRSIQIDTKGDPEKLLHGMRRASAPFMIVFALTVTFASFDWLMSLNTHWFSSIFGIYVFSGMVLSGLATITVAVVILSWNGYLGDIITNNHLYNLGGLLFAFVCFWGYIAFSQFMLIWYGNLPEEAVFFVDRSNGKWQMVTVLLVILRFVIPFFLLISRFSKMNSAILFITSIIILTGECIDVYWLIMPGIFKEKPIFDLLEAGPTFLMTGIFILWIFHFIKKYSMIVRKDPTFEESRNFHL